MDLEIKDLCFRYPYTRSNALSGLSWQIFSGRLIFLYAPEGRGKTTLLKILAGRYSPASGQILLDGAEQTELAIQERNAAYADEGMMFFSRRSVRYNLAYPLKVRGMKRREREAVVEQLARNTGIFSLLDKKVKDLTYPERLEVLISRLFTVKRDIILFDEVLKTAGEGKDTAAERIEKFARENPQKIVILASAEAADGGLFESAQSFTLDCGKIFDGVKTDEQY